MTSRQLRVFLCHSSKDKPAVRELYKKLRVEAWLDPWLDEEKLLPGQDWHIEIEKAVEATDVVVVLLSNQSVSQEGYVQRELKMALDVADEKPEGAIFIVPLRLDDCPAPRRLRGWHYVDYFPADRKDWAVERLTASLKARAESLGLKYETTNPTNSISPQATQAKSQTYETPVQEKKVVIETPKPESISQISSKQKYTTDGFLVEILGGMEFMRVPAGNFLMGSDNGSSGEKPQHTVDISYDYWMARFPVTNEQYNLYVKAKGIVHPVSDWEKKKDHPVVNVSWYDTNEYCQWLTTLLKAELLSGMTLRLPSEAEWEKAARGTDGREYPWGNTFDKNKCNSKEGGKGIITSVGNYSPQGDSPYGCSDMSGNVLEWTHSEYKAYPYYAKDGREDETKKVARILRGGACDDDDWWVRCASRDAYVPSGRYNLIGFRVARSLPNG